MERPTDDAFRSRYPYPPFELANRVSSLPGEGVEAFRAYEEQGAETRRKILGMLPEGTSLEGARLLDFGCGAGRTLRQFTAEAETSEVRGVDIDPRSVEWINRNLNPPFKATECGAEPPLDFESGSFDLIWAISVFTHLSSNSAEWLLELHRLLKPGGLLMASYMGEWNSETIAREPWDPDRIGMNRLFHNRAWDDGGPMVLMSDWWVREHWGRAFEIVASDPWVHNQHWLMLRRKEVDLTPEELLAPGSDPREWIALRHNVTQLQREIEALCAEWQTQTARINDYESSFSWRVTRPLRSLAARARGPRRSA